MILSIELKCFRKHEDLRVDFTSGLNVIRGANEQGKSTLLESVLYCLYGWRALRNGLEDVVTWGHKETELKASTKILVGKLVYTFKRSKSGAECSWTEATEGELAQPTKTITGQTEVSNFAAELLGADLKSASSLMLANQNSLRGALDEGPAAVSMLMSKLADFDLIDRLLASANEKLLVGATAPLQARLTEQQARLEEARKVAFEDPAQHEAFIEKTKTLLVAQRTGLDTNSQVLLRAEDSLKAAQSVHAEVDKLNKEVWRLTNEQAETGRAYNASMEEAKKGPSAEELTKAEAAVTELDQQAATAQLWARFNRAVYPEIYWDQPKANFDSALESLRVAEAEAGDAVRYLRTQVATEKTRRMTDGKCPTCGHSSTDPEHMTQHNAEVDAKVEGLEAQLAKALPGWNALRADIAAMGSVAEDARIYWQAVAGLPVTFDGSVYPDRAVWAGPPVIVTGDPAADRAELAALRQRQTAASRAEGMAQVQRGTLDSLVNQISIVRQTLDALQPPEMEPLLVAVADAARACAASRDAVEVCQSEIAQRQRVLELLRLEIATHQSQVATLERQIADLDRQVKEVEFNNTLMKKLKALKPAITDYLWGQVLAAVSTFFSQMRSEKSVVTKDGEGFKVNGKPVESLSGSTLDVLALAIRCALVKTFIPHANFLVLDEPAAGCDENRTGSVLGFVSSCGFGQVLMASHDVLSEAVADNVVMIGN